jgi:23S rRNA (adenine2503-C2)-methyltransferase
MQQWPAALRQSVAAAGVDVGRNRVVGRRQAKDGTLKLLLKLLDTGDLVECVGIPASNAGGGERLTVCVSTQVGCAQGCSFCATAKMGLVRSLTLDEVLDQVLQVQDAIGRRATNVVFMGMGEPLANYDVSVRAVRALNQQLGIGMRNLTLSTVGVPGTISRLAAEDLQATLAVSLHAPNQRLRESIVPAAKAYKLTELVQDCRNYVLKTGRRVTFEYCLLRGINDSPQHAHELAKLMRGWQCHLNVIPWNPIDEADFRTPRARDVDAFIAALGPGLSATVRQTRGAEEAMACGQLRVTAQQLADARRAAPDTPAAMLAQQE